MLVAAFSATVPVAPLVTVGALLTWLNVTSAATATVEAVPSDTATLKAGTVLLPSCLKRIRLLAMSVAVKLVAVPQVGVSAPSDFSKTPPATLLTVKVRVCAGDAASGSVAARLLALKTTVPFSVTVRVLTVSVGASLAGVTTTVVALLLVLPPTASVTVTVKVVVSVEPRLIRLSVGLKTRARMALVTWSAVPVRV